MKSHVRTVLFTLLVALPAACGGGDRDDSKPTVAMPSGAGSTLSQPELVPPAVVTPVPTKIEIPVVATEPLPVPTKFADAMELGKALVAKGDPLRAREMFEAAAKLDKKKSDPHIELARMFISINERGLAIKSANKAVKLAPESSQAWNTLGRAELLRFNYDNAIVAFRQATELNADNVWAWNNLGFAELQQKHYPEAIDALMTATSKPGATGYMFNNLGTAYEQLDQLDDARGAFDKGGELGSVEAKASRKRLDGVDTIVVTKTAKAEPVVTPAGKTFEVAEPMPDDAVDETGVKVEVKLESATVDEPVVAEPKVDETTPVEAPKSEPKSEPNDASVSPI